MGLSQLAAQADLIHSRRRSGAVQGHCRGHWSRRRRCCCCHALWGRPGWRGSRFVGSCRPHCCRKRLGSPVARRSAELLLARVACACIWRGSRARQGAAVDGDLAQRLAERRLLAGTQAVAAGRQRVLGQRGTQHLHSRTAQRCLPLVLDPTLPLAIHTLNHTSSFAAPTWLLIPPDAGTPLTPPSGEGSGCGSTRLCSCSAVAARLPNPGWSRGISAAAGTGRLGRWPDCGGGWAGGHRAWR